MAWIKSNANPEPKGTNLSERKEYIVERDKGSWFAQLSMICGARTCLIFPLVLTLPYHRNVLEVYSTDQ